MDNRISAYFYLEFGETLIDSIQQLIDSIKDTKLIIRNIWNDSLHKPEVELEGPENEMRSWYSKMVIGRDISDEEWKHWKNRNL